jgi:flagellar basal-body rod protein FlgB
MTTNPKHLPLPGVNQDAKTVQSRMTYEVAPNNNAVIIEEQMVKANETQMDYNLMTNLMRKNIGMYYTALGRNN